MKNTYIAINLIVLGVLLASAYLLSQSSRPPQSLSEIARNRVGMLRPGMTLDQVQAGLGPILNAAWHDAGWGTMRWTQFHIELSPDEYLCLFFVRDWDRGGEFGEEVLKSAKIRTWQKTHPEERHP